MFSVMVILLVGRPSASGRSCWWAVSPTTLSCPILCARPLASPEDSLFMQSLKKSSQRLGRARGSVAPPRRSPRRLGARRPASLPCPSAVACLPLSPPRLLLAMAARLPPGPCVVLTLLWCQMWLPFLLPLPPPPHGTALRATTCSR